MPVGFLKWVLALWAVGSEAPPGTLGVPSAFGNHSVPGSHLDSPLFHFPQKTLASWEEGQVSGEAGWTHLWAPVWDHFPSLSSCHCSVTGGHPQLHESPPVQGLA